MKGLTKAMNRLPQQLKEKTSGTSEITSDSDFALLLNAFRVFSTSVEKVHLSGTKYAKQLDVMLKELQNYCEHIEDILRGDLGGKPVSSRDDIVTPVELTSVKNSIETVALQLRPSIDQLVIICNKLELVNKANLGIEKTITKRDHKRIDYDRYKANVAEMEKKRGDTTATFSVKDEKKLQEITTKYSQADYEYNTIHTELKQQIPQIIALKPTLVEPILFQMFAIQSTLYASIAQALPQNLVNTPLDALYNEINIADTQIRQLETIAGPPSTAAGGSMGRKKSESKITEPTTVSQDSTVRDPPNKIRPNPVLESSNPFQQPVQHESPPKYSSTPPMAVPVAAAVGNNPWASQGKQQQPMVPPKPKPSVPVGLGTAVALFDFPGQEAGDLSFRQGDIITIIEKTNTMEDWWKGKLNGQVGSFPANYVKLQ